MPEQQYVAQDFVMSQNSLILVLLKKIKEPATDMTKDQRLHFERTGCRGILQPPRRQRTDIRRHEQRVWVEQVAKIFHGRKHRIPSADCIDTQLLQRNNGKN